MTGGRGLGPGSIRRDERGRYVLDYRDADRRQRRVVLSEDKRTAERMRAEIIKKRDLVEKGLAREDGQEKPLADVVEAFLVEVNATRATATRKWINEELAAAKAFLRRRRVRDMTVGAVMEWRRARMQPAAGEEAGREGTAGLERANDQPRRFDPEGVPRVGTAGRTHHR